MFHQVDGGIFIVCYMWQQEGKVMHGWMDMQVSKAGEFSTLKSAVEQSIANKVGTDQFTITSFTRIQ